VTSDNSIKVISLFCGCGGADLGLVGDFKYLGKRYAKNNIEIIHASDIDTYAVSTYNKNFRHKAIDEDVLELSFKDYKADIVVGGFPCQNFSTVNPNKRPDDKQSQLFWEMSDVVQEVRPKVFIAENVKGFYRLKKGRYFHMAKKRFEDLGYKVYHMLVNVSGFGIPQLRERLFMVGIDRKSKKIDFKFPAPTHGENSKNKKKIVPLSAVIESLVPEDPKYYFSKRAVEGVKRAKPNMKRALAQNLAEPCLTITSHLAKVSLNSRDPVLLVNKKKELYRRFTPREAARIQSFPDNFIFPVSETQAYRQIGNAVPPVYFWHLTRAVISQLF